MQFVRIENLKTGMRLARPIYSKKGVLLFDRDSAMTQQAIESVKNFGLLGIYILEPTEPLPPMSPEDLEYERFQTQTGFTLQDEIEKILGGKNQNRVEQIAGLLIKKYGHLSNKIKFYQNLRSREDYVYRHSLNVATLCTMMTHVMNIRLEEQMQTVCAALIHDIGRIKVMDDSAFEMHMSDDTVRRLLNAQTTSADLIEHAFFDGDAVRRICMQALRMQIELFRGEKAPNLKLTTGAKILLVANKYDEMTAMDLEGHTESEVKAIKELLNHPEIYDPEVVKALTASIHILFPGVSVELNTGEKALVLVENQSDLLRPTVLSFNDNSVIDLSLRVNNDIEITDIMKTLDNRYIMDEETLRSVGYLPK